MYNIAVIGGGASGFAAAVSAKETAKNASVIILERLSRSGKKLAATGNGKCNLSNTNINAENYHGSFDVMSVLERTPKAEEYFRNTYGVLCVTGSEGRNGGLYPKSNSANTVVNAIRAKIEELGIEEKCGFEVKALRREKKGYRLISDDEEILAERVIIACGGYAGTSFGTDGSMFRILKENGYKSAKICPAVASLGVDENLKAIKGVRVKGRVSAISNSRVLRTETGEIQFNENQISGICVFNLAYLFAEYEGRLKLSADLFPQMSEKELSDYLFSEVFRQRAKRTLEELLTGVFVKNLAVYLVKKSLDRGVNDYIYKLNKKDADRLAHTIKNLEFTVKGSSSWQNAQVTMGGIKSECVTENLESRLHSGVYFCGEILDVCGDCGGYNLQWAWSSGIIAGKSCALSLKGAEK